MKTSFPPDSPYIDHEDLPTLSELKQRAQDRTALGLRLVELTDKQLRRVPMDVAVREAVMEGRRLWHLGARKRQVRFVGRLLQATDVEPILQALADIDASVPFVDPALKEARTWTQRLIDDGQDGIAAFLEAAPSAERTRLSQLCRQYAKDVKSIAPDAPDAAAQQTRARTQLLNYVRAELT